MRYEKLTSTFQAFVQIAYIIILLRFSDEFNKENKLRFLY